MPISTTQVPNFRLVQKILIKSQIMKNKILTKVKLDKLLNKLDLVNKLI